MAPSTHEMLEMQEKIETELGCDPGDIAFAKRVGMSAIDLNSLSFYCKKNKQLLVIRSCNPASRAHYFDCYIDPKPATVKAKTGVDGTVKTRSGRYFSDYDMMSLWQFDGGIHKKIWTNGDAELFRKLNDSCCPRGMFTPTHGANDDFYSPRGDFLGDSTVNWDELLVVIDRHGCYFVIVGKEKLRRFYNFHRMISEKAQELAPGGVVRVPRTWPYH